MTSRRSDRRRPLVIGAMVLVALVVGVVLVRSHRAKPPKTADNKVVVAVSDVPVASPPPVVAGDRLEMPVDPSGSRMIRSEVGVRRTGLDYLTTVQQRAVYLTAVGAEGVLTDWQAAGTDAGEIARSVARLDDLRRGLQSGGGQIWWTVVPLAIKVDSYTEDRARVSVWVTRVWAGESTAGAQGVVPSVDYATSSVDLVWEPGRGWSVWAVADRPGPVPLLASGMTPIPTSEFIARLDGFSLVKEHS